MDDAVIRDLFAMIGFISWDSRIKSQLKKFVVLKVLLSLLVFKQFIIWAFIQQVIVNFVVM